MPKVGDIMRSTEKFETIESATNPVEQVEVGLIMMIEEIQHDRYKVHIQGMGKSHWVDRIHINKIALEVN